MSKYILFPFYAVIFAVDPIPELPNQRRVLVSGFLCNFPLCRRNSIFSLLKSTRNATSCISRFVAHCKILIFCPVLHERENRLPIIERLLRMYCIKSIPAHHERRKRFFERNIVLLRKLPVALVMRIGKYRARAVGPDDEIRDPHRDFFPRSGIYRLHALQFNTCLVPALLPLTLRLLARLLDICADLVPIFDETRPCLPS